MEGWGLLFAARLHLVWSGGGRSGQTCLNFIREQQEAKMTDQNRRLVIRVARNFLVVFLLKYHSLDEILGWGPFFLAMAVLMLFLRGEVLSLQTPAPDRINI